MTDRLAAFIVTLEADVREDDAEPLMNAIQLLRGVLSVAPVVSDPVNYIANERARHDLGQKLLAVVYPKK